MPDAMTEDQIEMVALVAVAAAAALGDNKISTARLVAACRTVPQLSTVTRFGVGRAMKGAGFQRAQWREFGAKCSFCSDRVRGYRIERSRKAQQCDENATKGYNHTRAGEVHD